MRTRDGCVKMLAYHSIRWRNDGVRVKKTIVGGEKSEPAVSKGQKACIERKVHTVGHPLLQPKLHGSRT